MSPVTTVRLLGGAVLAAGLFGAAVVLGKYPYLRSLHVTEASTAPLGIPPETAALAEGALLILLAVAGLGLIRRAAWSRPLVLAGCVAILVWAVLSWIRRAKWAVSAVLSSGGWSLFLDPQHLGDTALRSLYAAADLFRLAPFIAAVGLLLMPAISGAANKRRHVQELDPRMSRGLAWLGSRISPSAPLNEPIMLGLVTAFVAACGLAAVIHVTVLWLDQLEHLLRSPALDATTRAYFEAERASAEVYRYAEYGTYTAGFLVGWGLIIRAGWARPAGIVVGLAWLLVELSHLPLWLTFQFRFADAARQPYAGLSPAARALQDVAWIAYMLCHTVYPAFLAAFLWKMGPPSRGDIESLAPLPEDPTPSSLT